MIRILIILLLLLAVTAGAQNPELTLQTGHSAPVTVLAFSSDRKYLASAGEDNIIIIWDFKQGKQLKVLKGHHQHVNAMKFTNQDRSLISAGNDGAIIYWDIISGTAKQMLSLKQAVLALDISEQDSLLVACGAFSEIKCYKTGNRLEPLADISVWPVSDSLRMAELLVKKGKMKKQFDKVWRKYGEKFRPVPSVSSVVIAGGEIYLARSVRVASAYNIYTPVDIQVVSHDGKLKRELDDKAGIMYRGNKAGEIYWSGQPSRIVKYNTVRNKKIYVRPGNFREYGFTCIASGPGDSLLAAANEDGNIYIWTTGGKYLRMIRPPGDIAVSVAFHPGEPGLVISGNKSGDIVILDINNGKVHRKLESGIRPVTTLAVNPSGTLIAIGGTGIPVSMLELGRRVNIMGFPGHRGKISGMHFAGDSVLISAGKDNRILISNVNSGRFISMKGNSNPVAVNALLNAPLYSVFLNSVTSFDYTRKFLRGNYESLDATAMSPDGKRFACGGEGFNKGFLYGIFVPRIFPIHIIDTEKNRKTGKIGAQYISIDCIGFNRTSDIIAGAGRDYKTGSPDLENIQLLNAAASLMIPVVGAFRAARILSTNRIIKYGDYNSLKFWQADGGKLLKTFQFPAAIGAFCFSPQNDTVLLCDANGNAGLLDWKTDTFIILGKGKGPLMFMPGGESRFMQGEDNTYNMYDTQTGALQTVFSGHTDSITGSALLGDGNKLVTTSLDGSVRIWDMANGSEIVTLYTVDATDFILKTPDYYYYATKNAKEEIGFTFGMKFYPFEQFDLQYNRPDIVLERLGCSTPEMIRALHLAYLKRLQKSGFTEEMFSNDFHLPETRVTNADKIPVSTAEPLLTIGVQLSDSKYLLDRLSVRVNDVPLYGSNGLSLREDGKQEWTGKVNIPLSSGQNSVSVSCMNEKGVESLRESFEIIYRPENIDKPDLYVVVIGASEYADKDWNLNYASKDASDVAALFAGQKGKYAEVVPVTLLNRDVTRGNIENVKQVLSKTGVDDRVIVFYAGHGMLDENLDYYLATYDMDFDNPAKNGFKYDELDRLLDSIPAREKLLMIDACHSGEVDKEAENEVIAQLPEEKNIVFRGAKPRGYEGASAIGFNNTFELMKELFADLRKGTGAIVISSAGGGEYAYEGSQWKNGVFTYSLREGLASGRADFNKDKTITVSELQNYVLKNVQKLTGGRQKPTMRQENIENDFGIWFGK
ncbi:MAG: caspase family protein [Bacteroidota bacterium]